MPKLARIRLSSLIKLGLIAALVIAPFLVIGGLATIANAQSSKRTSSTVIYGAHPRQQVDIYAPTDAVDDLPVVLFVHGGGWSMGNKERVQAKPAHFTASNYIFASTGYRLVPSVTVEEQAKDVGEAVKALVGQASALGVDPTRIVLMGHSAGAHLAALVATDPQYAGDALGAIKGVILLDGAGYDIAKSIDAARPMGRRLYNSAFGTDPERQTSLSPMTHVGGKDAPNWLALYVEERQISRMQSHSLADALASQGISASAVAISGTNHGRINREMGLPAGTAQTEAVDAFLERVLSPAEDS